MKGSGTGKVSQPDRNLEHEASPLNRLVVLNDEDVEHARRLLATLSGDLLDVSGPQATRLLNRRAMMEEARNEIARRRLRYKVLPEGMFGEPAWDILLNLYVEQDGARVTLAELTRILAFPGSTLLRWFNYLEDRGLVRRIEHTTDQRSFYPQLTSKGVDAINLYISGVLTNAS